MNVREILNKNQELMAKLYPGKDQTERYEKLADAFRAQFSAEPTMFVTAPGRTEVSGNHTDHQKGCVLAAAVDLDTLAAVRARDDSEVTVLSEGFGVLTVDISDLSVHEEEKETTYALIRGVAARLKELGYKIGGFEAAVTSTVFRGSGLSSSAAFEVLVGAIFDGLYGERKLDYAENARISQYAENVYFGKPSGLMDQMACAAGGLVSIDFGPEPAVVKPLQYDFAAKGYALCVVRAEGDHGELTNEYAAIPAEMKAVAAAMGGSVLSEFTTEQIEAAIPSLRKKVSDRAILRALHFTDETKRAVDAAQALRDDDLQKFFDIIIESGESSWKLLQNLYVAGSTVEELPLALELSRRMLKGRGAWRIHGGGFAGTIQAFVPFDLLDRYCAKMESIFSKGAVTVLSVRPVGPAYID